MRRTSILGVLALSVVVGCTSRAAPATSSAPAPTSMPTLAPSAGVTRAPTEAAVPPIDTSLTPVSLSALPAGAKEALELCGLIDYPSLVSGMAYVEHAPDAIKWVPFYGTEPALRIDRPMWLIATSGEIILRAGRYVDPTCVVINHEQAWIGTGGRWNADGNLEPMLTPLNPPTMRLPPLVG